MKKPYVYDNSLSFPQKIINYTFLLFIFIIMFLPLWNVFVMSTSTPLEAGAAGLKLWWTKFTIEGYTYVFQVTKLGRPFLNSVYITLVSTTIQVILSALAGYILIQNEMPFKNQITSFIMLTMMIPGDLTLVSLYQLNKQLHFMNTYRGLMINGLISGFAILLMRNYFLSIPYSLAESARIDGAKELSIFGKIFLPLAKPGVASVFFLEFVTKWNSIMIPAIIATDRKLFTLPLMLREMVLNTDGTSGVPTAPDNAIMAAIVISTVPLVIIYVFAQRFLLSGMTLGASKE